MADVEFKVGSSYPSWRQFFHAFNIYMDSTHQPLVKFSNRKTSAANSRIKDGKPKFPEQHIFASYEFRCTHRGSFRSKAGVKQTGSFKCGCSARVYASVDKATEKVVVQSINAEHNHDINPELYAKYPKQRLLSKEDENDVAQLFELKVSNKMLLQHVQKVYGKNPSLSDIRNIKSRVRAKHFKDGIKDPVLACSSTGRPKLRKRLLECESEHSCVTGGKQLHKNVACKPSNKQICNHLDWVPTLRLNLSCESLKEDVLSICERPQGAQRKRLADDVDGCDVEIKKEKTDLCVDADSDWVPTSKLQHGVFTEAATAQLINTLQEQIKREKESSVNADLSLNTSSVDESRHVGMNVEPATGEILSHSPAEMSGRVDSEADDMGGSSADNCPRVGTLMTEHCSTIVHTQAARVSGVSVEIQAEESLCLGLTDNCTHKDTQTIMNGADIDRKESVLQNMIIENAKLKQHLAAVCFTEEKFADNDDLVRFYTGLASWKALESLVSQLSLLIPHGGKEALSKFQEIILVLIKLRHDFPIKLLGDLFHVSEGTVTIVNLKVLKIMFENIEAFSIWPGGKEKILSTCRKL